MTFGGYQVAKTPAGNQATARVTAAVRRGELIRPESCELCGRSKPAISPDIPGTRRKSIIVAHHHKGYDFPLDIWWVCQSCNVILKSKTDLTKQQARTYILQRQQRPQYIKSKYYSAPQWEKDFLFQGMSDGEIRRLAQLGPPLGRSEESN
jgi:hypothetical protein